MQIILTPQAEKEYNRLPPPEKKKLQRKLLILSENAYAGKKLEGKLKEYRSLRAVPYRIVYHIANETVKIDSIQHRQRAYK